MKKYTAHIIWASIAIGALGGGYYWGNAGAVSSARSAYAGTSGAFGSSPRRLAGGTSGGGLVAGQIMTVDPTSITLQLANGNSEVVFYSSSTPVTEPTAVSPSILKAGTDVMVGGTTNSDGSMTAQMIQVRTGGVGRGYGSGASAPAGAGQ